MLRAFIDYVFHSLSILLHYQMMGKKSISHSVYTSSNCTSPLSCNSQKWFGKVHYFKNKAHSTKCSLLEGNYWLVRTYSKSLVHIQESNTKLQFKRYQELFKECEGGIYFWNVCLAYHLNDWWTLLNNSI